MTTEAGALLLPHAREIEELSRKMERMLFEQGEALAGTLRISCSIALSQFALSILVIDCTPGDVSDMMQRSTPERSISAMHRAGLRSRRSSGSTR